MNPGKRKENMADDSQPKRVKKDCMHGDKCYRRNPAHFREFSHPHLESILDAHTGGPYPIPDKYDMDKHMITEQLDVIVEKQLYVPVNKSASASSNSQQNVTQNKVEMPNTSTTPSSSSQKHPKQSGNPQKMAEGENSSQKSAEERNGQHASSSGAQKLNLNRRGKSISPTNVREERKEPYRPIVEPTRKAKDFLPVVPSPGSMSSKLARAAPSYILYTTITADPTTYAEGVTFLELLDRSLGELRNSLQINFMVDPGWLLAQYYFAGYSEKKLTILYGEECPILQTITQKKPHVTAHLVKMATPFGKHHTKMMIFCYEDESVRVVVSTANLYMDDWENRTQALWFSPRCPPLPPNSTSDEGESPTMFKKSLIKYLQAYDIKSVGSYVKAIQKCDFSHINVFLVASVPGSHSDREWGMNRMATLLRQYCEIPAQETKQWPLIAQASSLGSYGNQPSLWLTGDFLHSFTKIKDQPQTLTQPPSLKVVYPSLENVKRSHDGLLGGGCLPYAASAHTKQTWLKDYLYQWRAKSTGRDKAMPHIKSYTRISPDNKRAAYFLLTSANISKAAWGSLNKGNGALRIMSYEAGVLFLPRLVINEDSFPLEGPNRIVVPYDVPPTKYTENMSPWVSDYLCG